MRKDILATILLGSLSTGLYAGGDIGGITTFENTDAAIAEAQSVEPKAIEPKKVEPKVVKEAKKEEPKKEGGLYVIAKGISILGDDANNLSTDSGYGAGLDLGYGFGNGLAVELGANFAKNNLNNPAENEASYKTVDLSLAYTYDITKNWGIFGKVGYAQENTKINALNVDDSDNGLIYGGGLEYNINDNYAIVAEYEGSAIDNSLRGDAMGLGLKYNF
jgi:opacity protein-like surface antigen